MNRQFLILLLTILALVTSAISQPPVHPGIKLYQEGKNAEAVRSLEAASKTKDFEKNFEIWNYLGLSYVKIDDFKKARKAFEKAVKLAPADSTAHSNLAYVNIKLGDNKKAYSSAKKVIELDPKNVTAYYLRGLLNLWSNKLGDAEKDADQALTLDSAYPQGYVLKSNVRMAQLEQKVVAGSIPKGELKYLEEVAEILRKGAENCKGNPNHKMIVDELESVEAFYKYFSRAKTDPPVKLEPGPGVTPLKIIYKPKASYTDAARKTNTQGTITMAVLFAASGRVERVLLLKKLGSGLDENAIKAAYKIGFEPQKKDGKPVSVVRMLEMSFAIF